MIEPDKLGKVSMNLLDRLESEYGDEAELVRVLTVVEVAYRKPEEDDHLHTDVRWEYNDQSVPANIGLIATVLRAMIS